VRAIVIALAAVAVSITPASSPAKAAPPIRLADVPCAGCRAVFPEANDPVPLLVVLHGDWGHSPSELLTTWERHALPRGVALLSLACPRDLGCNGSYWQWNGDPSWVNAQVDALAAKRPIDRAHVWLAGWSGGASYMGMRAQEFQRRFAALVYHGGGIPPSDVVCPPAPAPVLFLVGDKNPLHHLAVRLRGHHDTCNEDVSWRLVPGADHGGEWSALDAHGAAILAWLSTKRLP
jgi:poly(3-hydroxybutyrate) depolymerase